MMAKILPCATRLRALLSYDEDTGELRWRCRVNQGVRAGDLVSRRLHKGHRYLRVKIDGQEYGAHRVIWKIKTGNEPPAVLDHIDCNALNNRWQNLREASPSLSNCNRKLQKNNSSGIKGVTWNKADERWKASISVESKLIYLGYFKNKVDAVDAIDAARPQLHGQFARAL
jgi:hypothetical protein